jgi:hypothetical protein
MQTEYLLVEGKNGLAGLSTAQSQPDPGRREGFRGRVHWEEYYGPRRIDPH